jgi:hypothetical protein
MVNRVHLGSIDKAYILYSIVLILLFGYLSYLHVYWGDESQAYLIARDCVNIFELLNVVSYEATPPGWHLLLYSLNKLIAAPYVMKLLNFVFFIGIIILMFYIKRGGFYLLKILTLSSYWIFFEWGLINRSYLMGVFFILLMLYLFLHFHVNSNGFFCFLTGGLACLSNGHSLIIAFVFVLFILASKRQFIINYRSCKSGLFMFFICFFVGVFFLFGNSAALDKSTAYKKQIQDINQNEKLFNTFVSAGEGLGFVQRYVVSNQIVWQNSAVNNRVTKSFFMHFQLYEWIYFSLFFLFFFIFLYYLRDQTYLLLFFLGSISLLLIANHISPIGLNLRHKGFYLLVFILTTFLGNDQLKIRYWMFFVLLISVYSNVVMIVQNFELEFSNSRVCSDFLSKKFNLSDSRNRISAKYWQVMPLIAYTNTKRAFIPQINKEVSYTLLDSTLSMDWSKDISDSLFISRSLRNNCNILINNRRFSHENMDSDNFYFLDSFNYQTIQYYERYFVYVSRMQ